MDHFNIVLDKETTRRIPFRWKVADGSFTNLSNRTITLKVKGGFTLVPELDPNDDTRRVLVFTSSHAATLDYLPRKYKVTVTTTDGEVKLWEGEISAGGFA